MRRLAPWLLLGLAVLAAGCGGSSGGSPSQSAGTPSEYETTLLQAGRVLSDGIQAIFVISTQPKSPSAIASEARRARAVLKAGAMELADARPPRNAERDNKRVVAALNMIRDEIEAYARAAEARDWKTINRLNRVDSRSHAFGVALVAFEDLRKKGYKVGAPLLSSAKSVPLKSCSGNTVTAPSVIGQTEEAAVRHLHDAGLDVTVFPQIKPNPHVPEGVVVHESPLNFPVCKGTSIWIIVSIGR